VAARRALLSTNVYQAIQERSGGDDERIASIELASLQSQSHNASTLSPNLACPPEQPFNIGLLTKFIDNPLTVKVFICLSPRRPNRWTPASVEELELNAGGIGSQAHQPAERIDFSDEMPLRRTPDRRIARHVRDGVGVERAQPYVASHARGGVCGLDPGVSRPNDDDVEVHREIFTSFSDTEPLEDVM